ncbi:hypothetical protein [Cystobacter fuscus]|uniref:hypothetical protein n=1 Tax=Cystobacter fuscus TaxID=43 RepID=UPI002B28F8D2|nr:hypothetical protein F0U63_01525 [Cystobacter fuscus]
MSYADAWREDRRRWRWLLLWALGLPVGFTLFVFGLGGLVLLLEHLLPPRQEEWLRELLEKGPSPNALFPIVMATWLPGCVLLGFKVFMFACPRCGESFYTKGFTRNPYTSKCMHCGLRKGAVESSGGDDPRNRNIRDARGETIEVGSARMQVPIFIVGAGVHAFHCVEDAGLSLEPADIDSEPFEAFDSTGLRLRFKVVSKKTRMLFGLMSAVIDHVELEPAEDTPMGQQRLRELLGDYLEGIGKPREWIQRLSHDELVREVAALTLTRVR